ncbi:protein CutA homolog [Pectinophora gossypiella]|uniref:protein CutA homolog n=1 Tax=Pectinophora gossypiella TaxID=13191 RepID=UPI00214F283A|nr:protein CutA homolog [Pectinophora gossypiella]
MVLSLGKKSLLTLYLSILRPCLSVKYANMSSATSGSGDADKYSVAYVTVPDMDVGKNIAHGLVEKKLAACVNIVPQITSVYEWKGEINEDNEALLMIKTRTTEVDKLTEFVRSNHPYEVCEVISLPIKNGNPPYLKWIGDMVPGN